MPTRHNPRREPRVMAVIGRRRALAWAVVDPVEIRSTGETTASRRLVGLALRHLLLREKPTAIVPGPGLGRAAAAAGERLRIPLVAAPRRLVDEGDATALYPELPVFAASPLVVRAARLAVTALLTSTFPPRTYAHRRYRAPVRARRRARTLRGPRNPDRPDAVPARVP